MRYEECICIEDCNWSFCCRTVIRSELMHIGFHTYTVINQLQEACIGVIIGYPMFRNFMALSILQDRWGMSDISSYSVLKISRITWLELYVCV